jgi:hypothetical protein
VLDYFRDIDDDGIKADMKTIKVVNVMVAHSEGGREAGVLENRVLRRIFGSRRDEVTGECRKLYNMEFNNLYFSQNIIWVIKSRRMKWAGHVARMGERRGANKFLVGKP